MYQITQFKPALYLLLFLGMLGFALASASPLALVLGCGGVAINGWLVLTGRFRPMPRMLANLITIASMLFVARQLLFLREGHYQPSDPLGNPVLIIGHFLVVLQLVKAWEQRVNRDYGQLLVLGLLQMVAASINTNQLAFGALLAAYLMLSLYTCLLFHLKVEGDRARARAEQVRAWATRPRAAGPGTSVAAVHDALIAPGAAAPRRLTIRHGGGARSADIPNAAADAATSPAALALDPPAQKRLNRSMRRLAAVVAVYAVTGGLLTFLFFPRGPGNGVLAQAQMPLAQVQTGYTDTVNFSQFAPLLADPTVVAHVRVSKNGRPLGTGQQVYLRGATNSRYRPDGARESRRDNAPVFVGSVVPDGRTPMPPIAAEQRSFVRDADPSADAGDTYEMQFTPTATAGNRDLFVMSGTSGGGSRLAGPQWFQSRAYPMELRMAGDGSLRSPDLPGGKYAYELASATRPPRLDVFEPTEAVVAGRTVPALRVRGLFHTLRQGMLVTHVAGRPLAEIPVELRVLTATEAYYGGRLLTYVWATGGPPAEVARGGPQLPPSVIPPEVAAYARRPDVSGEDEAGQPLAAQRNPNNLVDPLDWRIAENIERHLRNQFTYSTDITDATTRAEKDPIVWFLTAQDGRRGHCEYFAWAMALLCQSLGMDARVALGFKCDEYNPFSQEFVVKQLHAHAWVEVLTTDGWRMYDPTSGRGDESVASEYSTWQQAKHLFDWLESAYTNNVIYYSNESRDNLIQSAEAQMTRPLYAGVNKGWLSARLTDTALYRWLTDTGGGLVAGVLAAAAAAAGGWYARKAWRRWRLRRRAERIGLDALPEGERLRLARQLGFYDDLLTLLERRDIRRQPHQTPLEFAQSLLYLPADVYETVHRLTELFYRVRYGQQNLSGGLKRRVAAVVAKLDADLGAPAAAG